MGPCGEEHHLWASRPSEPGVAGRLDSCTVSSLGAAPLAPLDDAFIVGCGSSWSLFTPSSLAGMRDVGAGDELWTTIEGVDGDSGFLFWVRREFLRERERASPAGGGDFNRGDTGQ